MQMFIDPKTVSKMVFITGDVSEGSDNDLKLKELIGPNWKVERQLYFDFHFRLRCSSDWLVWIEH
jgi:hypothetical protein